MEEHNVVNKSNDLNIINYKDFERLCMKDCGLNVYAQFRYIVNFFIENRNQKDSYFIDTKDAFVNDDLLSSFNGFCTIPLETFKNVNRFIVFVDANDPEDSYFNEIEANIPSSINPTHVCILSDNVSVVNECFRSLKEINPNLRLVNVTNEFNVSTELTNKVLKRISRFPNFCIADYCKELSYNFNDLNDYSFYKRFDEIVDEILEKSKSHIVYFGGQYLTKEETIYKLIVTECSLRNNNFKFYIEDESSTEMALRISSCLFDPKHQLVEDVVSFIENFPKICLELRGSSILTNFISECNLTLKLKYVPLNTLDKKYVKVNKVKSNQIKVVSVNSLFNLESDDVGSNIEQEMKLRELIKSLYEVLELNSGIIDLTNLVFFELDGITNVGYNQDYDIDIKCSTHCAGLPVIQRRITDFDSLHKFMYLPVFANGGTYIKNLANKTGGRFNATYGRVRNNVRKNTSIVKYTDLVFSDEFLLFPNSLFLLGMSNKSNRIFRESIRKELTNILDLDKVRNRVDSFGCFNKISNNILEI